MSLLYYHPSFVSIILSAIFYYIRNKNILLKILLLIITILYTCTLIIPQELIERISISASHIITSEVGKNHFFESCIMMVLVFAHSYALYKERVKEFIFGSLYGSASFFVLEAKDYISIFFGLEFMMIFATIIIYLGKKKKSTEEATNYFITHFISGSLFLIGIIHLKNQGLITHNIENLSSLLISKKENIGAWCIFISLLINVGSFPFSGWIKNSYSNSDNSGFLYLIFFTTKVCLLLMTYLFPGARILIFCGLSNLFYGLYRFISEKNSINNLCYLANIYVSFVLILLGSELSNIKCLGEIFVVLYIIGHYIYKLPLCFFVISFADITNGNSLSDIKGYCSQNRYVLIYLAVILMFIIGANGTINFYMKQTAGYYYKAAQEFDYTILYYLLSCILFIKIFQTQKNERLQIIQYKKYKFYMIMLSMAGILCFVLGFAAVLNRIKVMEIFYDDAKNSRHYFGFYYFHLKPLIMNILSLIVGFYISKKITLKQNNNRALNLIDILVQLLYFIANIRLPQLYCSRKHNISAPKQFTLPHQGTAIMILLLFFVMITCYVLYLSTVH